MVDTQLPPLHANTSNAPPGIIGVSFLFAITLATYIIRMYTRIRPTFKLAAPDYLISAALVCELATLINLLIAIRLGVGRYDYYISQSALPTIQKCLFALGFSGFWASSLARISIGSMLLRFDISKTWRVVLWILIFIQFVLPVAANIFQLLQCRPIRSWWDKVPGAVCWSPQTSQSYSYIYSSIGITSDLVFAIMPMFFIFKLHRPLMERILITFLMALGIIAAVAGVMKVVYIHHWNPREDSFRVWMPLFWWYRVEEIGLIAAACAPFLKPLIERVLGRFGVPQFRFATVGLNTIRSGQGDTPKDFITAMPVTLEEQELTQQKSNQTESIASSAGLERSRERTKSQSEHNYGEV